MMRNSIACCLCILALLYVTNSGAEGVSEEELVTGKVIGREIFGLAYDMNNDPLMIGELPLIFKSSVFDIRIASEDSHYLISGFGDAIGGLYLSQYDEGRERYIDTRSFDLSAVAGLSQPRGGVVTSWGSVLMSESGLIDAADATGFIDEYSPVFKGKKDLVKPYNYGWVAEAILLDDKGNAKIIKHYSVGRLFASSIHVMPDTTSVYLLDADNTGQLYLYVAKDTGSLSAGSLYGVRLIDGAAVYELLGETSSLKMKFKLKKISFDMLFDKSELTESGCDTGFTRVSTIYGDECLKVNKRNKRYAGLFEPIRMLAIKGKGQTMVKIRKMAFSADNSRIELTDDEGIKSIYSIAPDEKIGSNYVMQELSR